jgi:Co/Zn/Cd efflux system component
VLASWPSGRTSRRLDSPALIADGAHARADAYVSLAVVASAAVVALGLDIADPLIGLAITVVILRITWQSVADRARRSGPARTPDHVDQGGHDDEDDQSRGVQLRRHRGEWSRSSRRRRGLPHRP